MRTQLATGDEWRRPMPPGISADALRVLAARGVRAFGDGFVALGCAIRPIAKVIIAGPSSIAVVSAPTSRASMPSPVR